MNKMSKMTNKEIKSLINSRPEEMIKAAIRFNPEIKEIVEAAESANPEKRVPLAALAVRHAISTYGKKPSDIAELVALIED